MQKIKILLLVMLMCPMFAMSVYAAEKTEVCMSNTPGNIADGGRVLKLGDWVYYSFDGKGFYRMKEDGSQKTKLFDGYVYNIGTYEDKIYCTIVNYETKEAGFYRINPDGTNKIKISENVMDCVNIFDGWIYYISPEDSHKPYKMRIDGSEKQRMNDYPMSYINVTKDWIYFQNHIDRNCIYKMKLDGTGITKISGIGDTYTCLNLAGDWLYFFGDYDLCKININGGNLQKLYHGGVNNINIKGDWIYFSVFKEGIFKMKTDGTNVQKLLDQKEYISGMCMTDEWIYYEIFYGSTDHDDGVDIYRMKFDGSSNQKFKITEYNAPDEVARVKIKIDGKYNDYSNVPINVYGRILLPFREVLTNLGVKNDDDHIIWDGKERSVTVIKDDTKIVLKIDNTTAIVNGEKVTMDVAPMIYKDRTYIPTRFIAQSLGKKVLWDGENEIVSICDQEVFDNIKNILDETIISMDNDVESYSINKHVNFESDWLNFKLENLQKMDIDLKNKVSNIFIDGKFSTSYELFDSVIQEDEHVLSQMRFEDGKTYVKNINHNAWYLEEDSNQIGENVFDNFEFLNTDENFIASFTLEETDDCYILRGACFLEDLVYPYLQRVLISRWDVGKNVETEIVIYKDTYYLKKVMLKGNGLDRDLYYRFKFDIVYENENFNDTDVVKRPEDLNPLKLANKDALELVEFVEDNYLYYDEVDDFSEKSQSFIYKSDYSRYDVMRYIESIRAAKDQFTYVEYLNNSDNNSSNNALSYDNVASLAFDTNFGSGSNFETMILTDKAHYIKIDSFEEDTGTKVVEELEKIENPQDKALIIDLRGNPGGYLISASIILDALLPKIEMYKRVYRDGSEDSLTSSDDYIEFKKIVVLVDKETASSSELVALCLKLNCDNAIIIGQLTFGKSVGQTIYQDDERRYRLNLVSFNWNVNGTSVYKVGVIPDIFAKYNSEYILEVNRQLEGM